MYCIFIEMWMTILYISTSALALSENQSLYSKLHYIIFIFNPVVFGLPNLICIVIVVYPVDKLNIKNVCVCKDNQVYNVISD